MEVEERIQRQMRGLKKRPYLKPKKRQKPLTSSWGEQMTHIEQARKLRPLIERAAASLPDKEASEGAALFPRLTQG